MSIVKYFMLFQLLVAGYSIIRFIITPIEEKITIQLSVFYFLTAWAIFGTIWMTKLLAEDWHNMMNRRTE